MKKFKRTYLFAITAGLLVSFIPVLGDFHFESALLAGTAAAFIAGWKSTRTENEPELAAVIFQHIYLFSLPLFLFSLFSGCFTSDAMGFWILTPIPSVIFAIAIGRFFRKSGLPKPGLWSLLVLLWISVGVLFIEFFTLPQVYYFNHVWGAWPGPIYDESVTISRSFIIFRLVTLGWAGILWLLPGFRKSHDFKLAISIMVMGMLIVYLSFPALGIISPRSYLKKQLTVKVSTPHFDIYADSAQFNSKELDYWAHKHEFFFDQITKQLEVDWPEWRKIEAYLYGNAWQKKELVGAKFTSYVPVWLEQDQLHIAKEHLYGVLKHEMVHVISKQFGNRFFNASWSIGLVEGLAEGIAKDASGKSTLDQILAANPPYPTNEEMRNALTISGFYAGASGVSYTTAGSFVNYLLDEYPVEKLKQAYCSSDFEEAYQMPFDSLVTGWRRTLPAEKIDSVDRNVSRMVFSQRSIFQKSCPHSVSREMELWDASYYFETIGQDSITYAYLENLTGRVPENLLIKQRWAQYALQFGDADNVVNSIADEDSLPAFAFLKADAYRILGSLDSARYSFPPIADTTGSYQYSFEFRQDSVQWTYFLSTRYDEVLPSAEGFAEYNVANKMLAIQKAIDLNRLELIPEYSKVIREYAFNQDWFDVYVELIDRLIYTQQFDEAERWLTKLAGFELRDRYNERLQDQREWLEFESGK